MRPKEFKPSPGVYRIQCIKEGGCTLTNYGQYHFSQDEIVDLLSDTLPDTLHADEYSTAQNMCEDIGFEIAQRIAAGEFRIIERLMPPIDHFG